MISDQRHSTIRNVLPLIGALAIVVIFGCGSQTRDDEATPGSSTINTSETQDSAAMPLLDGKQRLPSPPQNALLGLVYINTTDSREWIYDGRQWVPHDGSVDDYYRELNAGSKQSLQVKALPAAPVSAANVSMGAHVTHIQAGHLCTFCHRPHDLTTIVSFDPSGPVVALDRPAPGFDPTAKSCSNISCHGLYSGTFSYFFPGGDGVPVLNTISYTSNNGSTPSWYVAGLDCNACHGNPPRSAGATPVWHSGSHGGGDDCQLCHTDATGSGGTGTAITDPSLHVNGAVNVQARFGSTCFNCH